MDGSKQGEAEKLYIRTAVKTLFCRPGGLQKLRQSTGQCKVLSSLDVLESLGISQMAL